MKKQSLLLVLVLLLATLLFTVACGSTETATTPSVTTQTPSITTNVTTTDNAVATTPVVTTPAAPTVTTPADTTAGTPITQDPISVKLMTFNLRYDTTSHPCMSTEVRGAHLMEVIKKYMPDSISFCEATNDWMKYLRAEMKKLGYEGVGVGRDSGATGDHLSGTVNEHSPVFYRADKYELVDSDTFWLSTTPVQKGTISWGSACKRVCTYAVLKDKESGAIYAHFGTHLDHVSEEARVNSILVIESYMRAVCEKYGDIGIALSGDFNDTTKSTTYKSALSFMDDSRDLAKEKLVEGSSWSGFQSPTEWAKGHTSINDKPTVNTNSSPIDYIFLQKGTATVSLYTIVDDVFTFEYNGKTWYNHPISDHYGVYCEATFTSPKANLIYDESKVVAYPTTITKSQTLPSTFEGLPVISDQFGISSSLIFRKPIDNILKADNTVGSVVVSGQKHGVWEIKLAAESVTDIKGLSITTGKSSANLPSTLRIYVSDNGETWKQLGNVYLDDLTASSTYYIAPKAPLVRASHIKIVFSDCSNTVELANVTVYGK